MKSFKAILTLSLLTIFLTGCSFYADLYFLNRTEEEVTVTIFLTSEIEKIKEQEDQLQLKYADKILEVNDKTIDQLTGKLEYQTVNSMTVKITLPPRSTTIIGGGYNGLPRQFEKYTIAKNSSTKTITTEELGPLTEKTGGIIPPFHFTYKIE